MNSPNRTLAAAGAILIYATIIGYIDNFVRGISEQIGLWQFQAMRSVLALAAFGLAAWPLALRLRPLNLRAVLARSVVHSSAMMMYFGSLAFLSVAQAAAGLFTAPLFVLILSRFVYGHALGPVRIVAALVGFAGVLLVLSPDGGALSPAFILPLGAGALYGLGNLATREWCEGESAATLTMWYVGVIGVMGGIGMVALMLVAPVAAAGADGFLMRGPVWPTGATVFWTAVQAIGSVVGVGLMVRAYQLAEASRVSVFEYVILPLSAGWSWLLWGQTITPMSGFGMALIVVAGAMIAARGR
ncbi:MAG: DMT family transporter [Gemmobacter sp.]|nr:DMT family transporter [Gemmobacter sp.]